MPGYNGNKILTTSGGGMLVSDNEERIEKARFWATQARDRARHYEHSELGYNYRLSNVLAGIGRGQLKVLSRRLEKKRYIFNYYQQALGDLPGVKFMPVNDWDRPNFWLTCLQLAGKVTPLDIIEALEEENIEARPLWKPMHLQPYYRGCDFVGGKVAERLFEHGVCLPSDTKMTDADLSRVVEIIRSIW